MMVTVMPQCWAAHPLKSFDKHAVTTLLGLAA